MKDYNYCYYLVAFIDILGQKNAFKDIDFIPTDEGDDETKKRLINAHEQTVLFIDKFREGFNDIFTTYIEERESNVKVPSDKKEKFDQLRKCVLKHHRFSDCVQAYVPFQTDRYHSNVINGVFGIFAACGGMLLFSLAVEKAFRAGIEVGIGTELSNGEMYGPAFFKAYELESKIAQYPRIVIGNELINYLRNLSVRNQQIPNQDKEDIEACKIMADTCLKMIVKDFDGHFILDYLGNEFRKKIYNFPMDDRTIQFEEIYDKAYKFVEKEYTKHRVAGDDKLSLRYYLLYSYFRACSCENK